MRNAKKGYSKVLLSFIVSLIYYNNNSSIRYVELPSSNGSNDEVDDNFISKNPIWGFQITNPGQYPDPYAAAPADCDGFPFDDSTNTVSLGDPPCTNQQVYIDYGSGFNRLVFPEGKQGPTFAGLDAHDGLPASKVAGNPALIQSNFGTKGNFELVVPVQGQQLQHWWRPNDDSGDPNFLVWQQGPTFAPQAIGGTNQSLIQSNFGTKGNFELVAFDNANKLFHLSNNNDDPNPDNTWNVIGLGD